MSGYDKHRNFSDLFIGQIKEILMENAIHIISFEVASVEEDVNHVIDYQLKANGGNIAVRVRSDEFFGKCWDWTIRAWIMGGGKTELQKLRDGEGKWYLYCWSRGKRILAWMLIDIDKARETGVLFKPRGSIPNRDHQSGQVIITFQEVMIAGCIVNSHGIPWDAKSKRLNRQLRITDDQWNRTS